MYGRKDILKQGIINDNNKGFSNQLDTKKIILSFIEWLNECDVQFQLSILESSRHYNDNEMIDTCYSEVIMRDFVEYTSYENDNDDDNISSCEIYLECYDETMNFTERIIEIDWEEMDYGFNFDIMRDGTCVATLSLKDNDTKRSFIFKRI